MRLENKVAIITGGASGFGKGIVKKFISQGAKVIVADLNFELAEQLVSRFDKESILALKVDVQKKKK